MCFWSWGSHVRVASRYGTGNGLIHYKSPHAPDLHCTRPRFDSKKRLQAKSLDVLISSTQIWFSHGFIHKVQERPARSMHNLFKCSRSQNLNFHYAPQKQTAHKKLGLKFLSVSVLYEECQDTDNLQLASHKGAKPLKLHSSKVGAQMKAPRPSMFNKPQPAPETPA